MKKILFSAAVLTAVLSLVSCSKEDIQSDTPGLNDLSEMTLDIEIPSLGGSPGTKAIKKSWQNGDRINIWFDDVEGYELNPHAIVSYDNGKWKTVRLSEMPKSTKGKVIALYEGYNDLAQYYFSSGYWYPSRQYRTSPIYAEAIPMTVYSNAGSYQKTAVRISCTVSKFHFHTGFQVVVTGLDSSRSSDYALQCNYLRTSTLTS